MDCPESEFQFQPHHLMGCFGSNAGGDDFFFRNQAVIAAADILQLGRNLVLGPHEQGPNAGVVGVVR